VVRRRGSGDVLHRAAGRGADRVAPGTRRCSAPADSSGATTSSATAREKERVAGCCWRTRWWPSGSPAYSPYRGSRPGRAGGDFLRLKATWWTTGSAPTATGMIPRWRPRLRRVEEQARTALAALRPMEAGPISPSRTNRGASCASRVTSAAWRPWRRVRTPGQGLRGRPSSRAPWSGGLSFSSTESPAELALFGGLVAEEIAIPQSSSDALLMEGKLSPSVVEQTVQTMRYFLMEEAPLGQNVICI